MAKTISRARVLAKSDRIGSKDKLEKDKLIKYGILLSLDKIDFTKLAKEYNYAVYWTSEDLNVVPSDDLFAELEVNNNSIRVLRLMTKKQYIESLG